MKRNSLNLGLSRLSIKTVWHFRNAIIILYFYNLCLYKAWGWERNCDGKETEAVSRFSYLCLDKILLDSWEGTMKQAYGLSNNGLSRLVLTDLTEYFSVLHVVGRPNVQPSKQPRLVQSTAYAYFSRTNLWTLMGFQWF